MDLFSISTATRFDVGLGNPNKTAALLAILMIAVWAFLRLRRGGFWTAFTLCAGLSYPLILTHSRGGVLAAAIGLGVLGATSARPWKKAHLLAIGIGVILFWSVAIWDGAAHRYSQVFIQDDASIGNRLLIWKNVPAMIAAAPSGWGLGNSGQAFVQWYQPIGKTENYRTLVGSHFTWMVELGWPLRILYVAAWAAVILLAMPTSKRSLWMRIGAGIWCSFFVASCFSSVAECPYLWPIPTVFFALALWIRFRDQTWPAIVSWTYVAGVTTLTILILIGVSLWHSPQIPLRYTQQAVHLGKDPNSLSLIAPSPTILGERYGHQIRNAIATHQWEGVTVADSDRFCPDTKTAVYVGSGIPFAEIHASTIILLNPSWDPALLSEKLQNNTRIEVLCGEFSRKSHAEEWTALAKTRPRIHFTLLPGQEQFLPNWMAIISEKLRQ